MSMLYSTGNSYIYISIYLSVCVCVRARCVCVCVRARAVCVCVRARVCVDGWVYQKCQCLSAFRK